VLTYLAHPIDHVTADRVSPVKFGLDCAARALRVREIAWFDPALPFGSPMADPLACYRINEAARKEADNLLAIWPPDTPSTGTGMEIQSSVDEGKPVAVVGCNGSMQLEGMGIPQFDWDGTAGPIEQAIDYLKQSTHAKYSSSFQIKYTGDEAFAPRRGVAGDAGFDLVCSQDTRVHIDNFVDVPCGISIELPYDCWAMIVGRSSTLRKRRLLVNQGIIDQGYRGPLFAGVWNLGSEVVTVEKGERIAQLIPMPLTSLTLSPVRVAELNPSIRGSNGFGSTGR